MKKEVKLKVLFVRVPEELHKKLRVKAAMKGLSLQDYILGVLKRVR